VWSQPVLMPGIARRCGPAPCLTLLVAALAAGCTSGLPSPSTPAASVDAATTVPALTPVPAVSTAAPATATQRPTGIPGPPTAALTPTGRDAIPGELGGFTWRGMGSDAPWLVPPADQAVGDAGPYRVTFAPPVLVESWMARWAPVADETAGAVAGSEQGGTGPMVLEGPDQPGTWSLQVDVRFADGGRSAYYWRLEVSP